MLSTENLVNGYKLLDDCFTLHVVWSLLIFDWTCFISNTMQDMSLTCFVVTVKQKEKNLPPPLHIMASRYYRYTTYGIRARVEKLRPIGLKMLPHACLNND